MSMALEPERYNGLSGPFPFVCSVNYLPFPHIKIIFAEFLF